HEEARRAVAALEPVVLAEGLLERRQRVADGEALDRLDRATAHLNGEQQARAHRRSIHDDRARAAYAVLAAQVGPRQLEIVAQEVGERLARLDRALVAPPVHGHLYRALVHACARATQRASARSV